MIFRFLLIVVLTLCLLSCGGTGEQQTLTERPGKREMAELNTYMVEKDRERIINYAERKGLELNETSTGLWYQIIDEGTGAFLKDNDPVSFEYECSLLDGTPAYSSDESGPRAIVMGKSQIEAGLNEGLRLLKPGGEAVFVIPPYLAHGLLGDRNKIPPRSVVVYHIKILSREI